ncbi:MAG: aldo/keto reductase [Patescibacteria group bacterium]
MDISQIPSIGLGTWRSPKNAVGSAVEYAVLKAGYRHIDCASVYGNEKEIGAAFNKIFSSGKIKREDVFITSKLWNTDHDPVNVEAACRKTLKDLQLEYLDLYLVHWGIAFVHGPEIEPMGDNGMAKTVPVPLFETWQAMEKLVEKGLVKNIGVANFTVAMLVDLLTYAKIKPAMDQVEIHPYNSQELLVDYCRKMGIRVTAYSPFGSQESNANRPINDGVIAEIAKDHGKTPAQVLVKWLGQRGIVAIPKSVTPERIKGNIDISGFELTTEEMKKIFALNRNHRFVDPIDWWGIPYFK